MLTQKDIRQKTFQAKTRGYSPSEVDGFLREAADTIDELSRINEALSAEVKRQNERLATLDELEGTLRDTLVTAQKNANDLMAQTRLQAQDLLVSAQAQAASIISQAEKDVTDAKRAKAEIEAAIGDYARLVRKVMEGQLDIMDKHFTRFSGEGGQETD